MANSSRLSCFDVLLFSGLGYLMISLNSNSPKITCSTPIVAWQLIFYLNILSLRVGLYIYCISTKLIKCALYGLFGILFPSLCIMTSLGQYMFA